MKSHESRIGKLEEKTAARRKDIGRTMEDFYSEIDEEFQGQWYAGEDETSRLMQQHQKRLKAHELTVNSNNRMRHYD